MAQPNCGSKCPAWRLRERMKVGAFRCLAPRLHGTRLGWNVGVERALSRATAAQAQPEEPALLSVFTRQIAPRYDGFSRFKHLGLPRHALGRSDLLRASAGPLAAGRSPDSFAGPTPRLPLAGRARIIAPNQGRGAARAARRNRTGRGGQPVRPRVRQVFAGGRGRGWLAAGGHERIRACGFVRYLDYERTQTSLGHSGHRADRAEELEGDSTCRQLDGGGGRQSRCKAESPVHC